MPPLILEWPFFKLSYLYLIFFAGKRRDKIVTKRTIVLQMILPIFPMQHTLAQAKYACSGPVTGVTINASGLVVSESMGGFSWVYVCQLGTNYNGVTPEACRAIHATLLIA